MVIKRTKITYQIYTVRKAQHPITILYVVKSYDAFAYYGKHLFKRQCIISALCLQVVNP